MLLTLTILAATWLSVYHLRVDICKYQISGGKLWKIDFAHTFKSERVMSPKNHGIVR